MSGGERDVCAFPSAHKRIRRIPTAVGVRSQPDMQWMRREEVGEEREEGRRVEYSAGSVCFGEEEEEEEEEVGGGGNARMFNQMQT